MELLTTVVTTRFHDIAYLPVALYIPLVTIVIVFWASMIVCQEYRRNHKRRSIQ